MWEEALNMIPELERTQPMTTQLADRFIQSLVPLGLWPPGDDYKKWWLDGARLRDDVNSYDLHNCCMALNTYGRLEYWRPEFVVEGLTMQNPTTRGYILHVMKRLKVIIPPAQAD